MISTIDARVSEMFERHPHPHLALVEADEDSSPGDVCTAILCDAKDFVEQFGAVIVDCPTAEELARDFMRRY